ncbi:MAG: ArsR family transcriptional regulator [Alphaproteobacteria bacterium]|nr:ArsR family transcriptional regulator [Alphaproteobacteria bacterium]
MESKQVIASLSALAQETRLAVFRLLVQAGPAGLPAGEIAARLNCPAATLSFHLRELNQAGLLAATRRSRSIIYAADFGAMQGLLGFLTENCCSLLPGASCDLNTSGCESSPELEENLS